jgi:hypothetical protein
MKLVVGTVVAGVLVAGVVASSAQSLADVARQEEARRKDIKTAPAKVYTDADVQKYAPVTTSAQQAATTVTALDANGAPVGQTAAANGLPSDEAGWRARMQNARDGLDRDRLLVSALEQQATRAALRSQSGAAPAAGDTATDDVPSRAAELKRLKGEMDSYRETLANAEEDARKAGIPPGWVR